MNQARLKKILKISSFFLFAFVTYHVYYQSLVPHLTARSEEDTRLSQSKYQIAYGQVRDFQKIGNFALAIDMSSRRKATLLLRIIAFPKLRILLRGKHFMTKQNQSIFIKLIFTKRMKGFGH